MQTTLIPTLAELMEEVSPHCPPIRTLGFLARKRIEFLLDSREGETGFRRAMHAAALIELTNNAYEIGTGFFYEVLKDRIAAHLQTARYQPGEEHFREILTSVVDPPQARHMLRNNLVRFLYVEPTDCIRIGLELHVLFDRLMRMRYGDRYQSAIEQGDVGSCLTLHIACDEIDRLVPKKELLPA